MHPSPAGLAGLRWLRLVLDGDLEQAWELTTPDVRAALAQSYALAATPPGSRDEYEAAVAELTSDEAPAGRWWPAFRAWRLARWQARWSDVRHWGLLPESALAGPDLELVAVVDDAARALETGRPTRAQSFVMRLTSDRRWQVAGIGRNLAVPGWPPSEQEIAWPEIAGE